MLINKSPVDLLLRFPSTSYEFKLKMNQHDHLNEHLAYSICKS